MACALARDTVIVPGFGEMTSGHFNAARQLLLSCGALLDAGTPEGPLNQMNAELISFAKTQGLKIVRDADELD